MQGGSDATVGGGDIDPDEAGSDDLFGGIFDSEVQIEHQSFSFTPSGAATPPIRITVNCVHNENQFLSAFVSRVVWPSAMACAQYICDHGACAFRGRSCVELGSGTGLCGLAASAFCAPCVLTDGDDKSLEVLRQNVALNTGVSVGGSAVLVRRLQWGAGAAGLDDLRALASPAAASGGGGGGGDDGGGNGLRGGFDFVLGTDVVYDPANVRPLLESALALMRRDGGAFLLANHAVRMAELQEYVSETARDMGLDEERQDALEGSGKVHFSVFRRRAAAT